MALTWNADGLVQPVRHSQALHRWRELHLVHPMHDYRFRVLDPECPAQ